MFIYANLAASRLQLCILSALSRVSLGKLAYFMRIYKRFNRKLAETERHLGLTRVATLPPELIIETTTRCNLRCALCFRERVEFDINRQEDIAGHELRRLARDFFPTAEYLNLSLTGEPLLTSHLDYMINACKQYCVLLSIVTNGTQLTRPELALRLIPVLGRLELSIDSADEATFAKLRGGASLNKILNALPPYAEAAKHYEFGFSITLSRYNIHHVANLVELAHRTGCNFVRIRKGVFFDDAEHEAEVARCYAEVYAKTLFVTQRRNLRLEMEPPAGHAQVSTVNAPLPICRYLYLTLHIDRCGYFEPCLHFSPPLLSEKQRATPQAWRSGAIRFLREKHLNGRMPESCQNCQLC